MELAKVHQAANTLDTVLTAWRGMKDLADAAQVVVLAHNELHLVEQEKKKLAAEQAAVLAELKKLVEQKEVLEQQARIQSDRYREMLEKALAETEQQVSVLRSSVDAVRAEVDKKVAAATAEAESKIRDAKLHSQEVLKSTAEQVQAAKAEVALWEHKLEVAKRGYDEFVTSVTRRG